ncbi:hypothetical protein ACFE04_028936 [Oxalis oulophora]
MYFNCSILLVLLLGVVTSKTTASSFNRSSFPASFVFGIGTSAYQYEGATREDGKGPSIWDVYTHKYPERIKDGTNGDVGVNFYHRYKAIQRGEIGVTILSNWAKGARSSSNSTDQLHNHHDLLRQIRIIIDFTIGSFLDPLVTGDYPKSMRKLLGDQLPEFTQEQSKMVKNGSFDFLGLNYYSSWLVTADKLKPDYTVGCGPDASPFVTFADADVKVHSARKGVPDSTHTYGKEIRDMLRYVNRKYNHPAIYIMENGKEQKYDNNITVKEALQDEFRINYITKHLFWLKKSVMEGINVKGYFPWGLFDVFEWTAGHTIGTGLYYVDYKNGIKINTKLSAQWFKNFLKK